MEFIRATVIYINQKQKRSVSVWRNADPSITLCLVRTLSRPLTTQFIRLERKSIGESELQIRILRKRKTFSSK